MLLMGIEPWNGSITSSVILFGKGVGKTFSKVALCLSERYNYRLRVNHRIISCVRYQIKYNINLKRTQAMEILQYRIYHKFMVKNEVFLSICPNFYTKFIY